MGKAKQGRVNILKYFKNILRWVSLGISWWSSGWESAFQLRRLRFEGTRIPRATGQLNPLASTRENSVLPLICLSNVDKISK